jgi:hypothetical protein
MFLARVSGFKILFGFFFTPHFTPQPRQNDRNIAPNQVYHSQIESKSVVAVRCNARLGKPKARDFRYRHTDIPTQRGNARFPL